MVDEPPDSHDDSYEASEPATYEVSFSGGPSEPTLRKAADEEWLMVRKGDLEKSGLGSTVCFNKALYSSHYEPDERRFSFWFITAVHDAKLANWSVPVSLAMLKRRFDRQCQKYKQIEAARRNPNDLKTTISSGILIFVGFVITAIFLSMVQSCGLTAPMMPR